MASYKLQFETIEERLEWNKMRDALAKHASYSNKKKYYPHNMDAWNAERKAIESYYRDKIHTSNMKRLDALCKKSTSTRETGRKVKFSSVRRSDRIAHLPEVHYYEMCDM
jgi:hypothetical protein